MVFDVLKRVNVKSEYEKLLSAIATNNERTVYDIITSQKVIFNSLDKMAAIHVALNEKNPAIALCLLENFPMRVSNSDRYRENGSTALYRAIELQYVDVMVRLMDWGGVGLHAPCKFIHHCVIMCREGG